MNATQYLPAKQAKILMPEEPGHFGYLVIPCKRDPRGECLYRYETITPGHVRVYKMAWEEEDTVTEQYDVSSHPGKMQCECGDHVFRGTECKHIRACLDLGLIVRVEADATPPEPAVVVAELLAAEAEGAEMLPMMANVRRNFSPAFSDRICELLTKYREAEAEEAELERLASCPDDGDDDADIDWADDAPWTPAETVC